MLQTETFQAMYVKATEALDRSKIEFAANEDARTYMVRGVDLDRAEKIVRDVVKVSGVRVAAKPGRGFSVIQLSVPTGTIEELAMQ